MTFPYNVGLISHVTRVLRGTINFRYLANFDQQVTCAWGLVGWDTSGKLPKELLTW